MKRFQQAGVVGALLLAVTFVLLLVFDMVILPSVGLTTQADRVNPAKVFAVADTYRVESILNIGFCIAILLLTVSLYDRLHAGAPLLLQLAGAAGIAGAVLILATGVIRLVYLPELASAYAQNPPLAEAAYVGFQGVRLGLRAAAIFAIGWFVLLASWGALQSGQLPRVLNALGLLFGAVAILILVSSAVGNLGPLPGIVWAVWLGAVLWREIAQAGRPRPSVSA